ncbi:hypothetical protein [Nocardioides sp. Iso805N]|uniref:hypothetical protein n=1 Tax=Nocardioides sp. Iso805N TaxID=1283287 RepID=UPI0003781EFB|nr:hypothetical protein [Nocardioides sp. Iso805N]
MRLRTMTASAATAVALVGLTATAAQAYTTYTPSGGPSLDLIGSTISFADTTASYPLGTCTTFDLVGSITSPGISRAYPASVGTLAPSISDCPITANATNLSITADAAAGTTLWPAQLDNVAITYNTVGCTFTAGGGAAGRAATISGTFDTSRRTFTATASTLDINAGSVAGVCFLYGISAGDAVGIGVGASWTNIGSTLSITNP